MSNLSSISHDDRREGGADLDDLDDLFTTSMLFLSLCTMEQCYCDSRWIHVENMQTSLPIARAFPPGGRPFRTRRFGELQIFVGTGYHSLFCKREFSTRQSRESRQSQSHRLPPSHYVNLLKSSVAVHSCTIVSSQSFSGIFNWGQGCLEIYYQDEIKIPLQM